MTKLTVKKADKVIVYEVSSKEDATFSDARTAHKMFLDASSALIEGRISLDQAHGMARLGEVAINALEMQLKIARQGHEHAEKVIEHVEKSHD